MTESRWETLRNAAEIIDSATAGFDTAEEEATFSRLSGALLEGLAVQFAVRRFGYAADDRNDISTALNEAAYAFEVRGRDADIGISCECYHEDVHDFSGCRYKDPESHDYCDCRATSGAVEEATHDVIAERVRAQHSHLVEQELALYGRVADELEATS